MVVPDVKESVYHLLKEHGNNRVKRELLLFWGLHPSARFESKAIMYALECNRLDTERALGTMVEEGLIDRSIYNGVTLYSLTTHGEIRQPVLELANLSWYEWELVLRRIEGQVK